MKHNFCRAAKGKPADSIKRFIFASRASKANIWQQCSTFLLPAFSYALRLRKKYTKYVHQIANSVCVLFSSQREYFLAEKLSSGLAIAGCFVAIQFAEIVMQFGCENSELHCIQPECSWEKLFLQKFCTWTWNFLSQQTIQLLSQIITLKTWQSKASTVVYIPMTKLRIYSKL